MTTLERIIEALGQLGHDGATAAELMELLGSPAGTISGQLSNGHKRGQLARLFERRNGKSVYVLPKYVNGRQSHPSVSGTEIVREARREVVEDMLTRRNREGWTEGYRQGYQDAVRDMMAERRLTR